MDSKNGSGSSLGAEGRGDSPFIKFVKGDYFDYLMGVFLMLNALAIGIQVDYMARSASTQQPLFFRVLDLFFSIVFSMELTSRLFAWGRKLYWMPGWRWAWFDTVIVAFAVMEEFAVLLGPDVQDTIADFGVIRILRLGRVVRLIRMVRLIPELKSMVYLIMASMSSFFWTTILIMILVYCFAVYFTEMATELSRSFEGEKKEDLNHYWGSVGRSILSLFMAITGGDDWNNFVAPLSGTSSYMLNTALFSMYIAFTTMVMLNLVTGVFVEGAQKIFKEEKEGNLVKLTAKMFAEADKDNSEEISLEEFEALVAAPSMDEWFMALGFSVMEAEKLFAVLDTDSSGSLSLQEFARGCLHLRNPVKAVDLAMVQYNMRIMSEELAETISSVYTLVQGMMHQIRNNGPRDVSNAGANFQPSSIAGSYCSDFSMEEELV